MNGTEIHNRFEVVLRRASDGQVKQRVQAFNVVCDTLWERLASAFSGENESRGGDHFRYILYGSGTGTPSVSDTDLFSREGGKALSLQDGRAFTCIFDAETHTAAFTGRILLGAGEAVGVTVTEVGIGYDERHPVTHAMLEDMNGNPMPVSKTELDELEITATVYVHFAERYNGCDFYLPEWDDPFTAQPFSAEGGLAAWLCGVLRETEDTESTEKPCCYLRASAEEPETVRTEDLSARPDFVTASEVSFSASDRTLRASFLVPPLKCNIEGGIRYFSLYSFAGTDPETGEAVYVPAFVLPQTEGSGRGVLFKDEHHYLLYDAAVSFRDGGGMTE